MNNLGGVFVFLIGGLALALLIALIEFLVNAFVNSKTDKVIVIFVSSIGHVNNIPIKQFFTGVS